MEVRRQLGLLFAGGGGERREPLVRARMWGVGLTVSGGVVVSVLLDLRYV